MCFFSTFIVEQTTTFIDEWKILSDWKINSKKGKNISKTEEVEAREKKYFLWLLSNFFLLNWECLLFSLQTPGIYVHNDVEGSQKKVFYFFSLSILLCDQMIGWKTPHKSRNYLFPPDIVFSLCAPLFWMLFKDLPFFPFFALHAKENSNREGEKV